MLDQIGRVLARRGYMLRRTGEGYLDADQTIRDARKSGRSLHEYIYRNDGPEKAGRTDRIVAKIAELIEAEPAAVAEIGTGTGIYLERLCRRIECNEYHIFEADAGWRRHALRTLSQAVPARVHHCDGSTLKELRDSAVEMVHAHAVFVYVPTLVVLSYLREAARVLKPLGYLVFDCFLDSKFKSDSVDAWLASEHRFPNVMSSALLFATLHDCGFEVTGEFDEIYGPATCNYLICRKIGAAVRAE